MKPAAIIAAFKLQREVGGTEELGKCSSGYPVLQGCAAVHRLER